MISENKIYYCESNNNPLQFFINIFSIEDLPFLFFECSHELNFEQFPQLKKLMRQSVNTKLSDDERAHIITTIYFVANKINTIEKKFWVSDNNKSAAPTVNKKTAELVFKENTAYTAKTHSYIFQKIKEKFETQNLLKKNHKVSSTLFEENIGKNSELQNEYLVKYSANAEYYCIFIKGRRLIYQFFLMYNREIVLFFFKQFSYPNK